MTYGVFIIHPFLRCKEHRNEKRTEINSNNQWWFAINWSQLIHLQLAIKLHRMGSCIISWVKILLFVFQTNSWQWRKKKYKWKILNWYVCVCICVECRTAFISTLYWVYIECTTALRVRWSWHKMIHLQTDKKC